MSTIQGNVKEYREINLEIKRLKTAISELKKRSTVLEKNIITYLNEKETPGLKYQNTAIIIENKEKRITKGKKESESDAIKILESQGIANPKEVLQQLADARKGDTIGMQKVKMQKFGNPSS